MSSVRRPFSNKALSHPDKGSDWKEAEREGH